MHTTRKHNAPLGSVVFKSLLQLRHEVFLHLFGQEMQCLVRQKLELFINLLLNLLFLLELFCVPQRIDQFLTVGVLLLVQLAHHRGHIVR